MNNAKQMLAWLRNRCIFRYKEKNDSQVLAIIDNVSKIIDDTESCNIDPKILDKIISKYYFDFEIDKSTDIDGFEIGFTAKDRALLRHNTIHMIKDIIEHVSQTHLNQTNKQQNNISDIFNNEAVFDFISDTIQA
jgi:hypothetical protein